MPLDNVRTMSKVFAYVDETGDRGLGHRSSPVFGMAAVLVRESDAAGLRTAVETLRSDFQVPSGKVLSWKDHVKVHDRRRRAADVLAAVPGIQVLYVYAKKSSYAPGTFVHDPTLFYNYVAFKMYKAIVWGAKHGLGASEVNIRFGHLRHHDHKPTRAYIEWQASLAPNVPDRVVRSMKWVNAASYSESQAADLFGGFLRAAVWPAAPYGYVEPAYLLRAWSCIRNAHSCVIPLGIFSMPNSGVLKSEPWFPCRGCTA